VEKIGPEAKERDDLVPNPVPERPSAPIDEIWLQYQVFEAISQRARHGEVHSAFGRRISSRNDDPTIRQDVLSEFTVEHQLIAAGLSQLRCRGKLIEQQDALAFGWKELRGNPFGPICRDPGQTAQIDRVELNRSYIAKFSAQLFCNLSDDLRLAHAA